MSNLTVDLQANDGESRSRRQRQRTAGLVFIVALVVLLGKAPPAQPPPPEGLAITTPAIGDTVIGQSSTPATVTLTNRGDAAVRIDSIISSNPAFGIGSDGCSGKELERFTNCAVDVIFRPTQRGPVSGEWTITDGKQNRQAASFTGNGLLRRLVVAPESVAFGSALVDTVPQQRVRISNDGDVPISLESVTIDPADTLFSIAPEMSDGVALLPDPCQAGPIAPQQSCEVMVRFAARTVGEFPARLVVSGTGGVVEASVPVNASATKAPIADLQAVPPRVVMTNELGGVVVTNSGNAPAQITNAQLVFGDENPWLRIAKNQCTGTLLPNTSCSITVLMLRTPERPARLVLDVAGASLPTVETEFAPPLRLRPGVNTLPNTVNPG